MADRRSKPLQAIAIGASAGAVEALMTLLGALPAGFPLPVIIVVHIPPDKESMLPRLLDDRCRIDVVEAGDKEPIKPATVYVAPPDYHLLVEKNGLLSLSSDEPIRYSRPSIDVLFETAADCYGESLLGIVLTGGNSDGSLGLRAIIDAGGAGIVQSPSDAYSPIMPKAALKACPEAMEMPLEAIANHLKSLASK